PHVGVKGVKIPPHEHSIRVIRVKLTFLRVRGIKWTLSPKLRVPRWFICDLDGEAAAAPFPKNFEQIAPYYRQFAFLDGFADLFVCLAFIVTRGISNVFDHLAPRQPQRGFSCGF